MRLLALLLAIACLPLVSAFWLRRTEARLDQAAASLAQLRAEGSKLKDNMRPSPPSSYVAGLPSEVSTAAIVSELQSSSHELAVALVSVSIVPRTPEADRVGRIDIAVMLRGAYPQIKATLGVLLDRFPDLIFQHLELRRQSTPNQLDARLNLVAISRPVAAFPK